MKLKFLKKTKDSKLVSFLFCSFSFLNLAPQLHKKRQTFRFLLKMKNLSAMERTEHENGTEQEKNSQNEQKEKTKTKNPKHENFVNI